MLCTYSVSFPADISVSNSTPLFYSSLPSLFICKDCVPQHCSPAVRKLLSLFQIFLKSKYEHQVVSELPVPLGDTELLISLQFLYRFLFCL